ncbi:MAG: tRNA pseudouridine(38-40) synthase TruA [Ferruginibacter sp.]
MISRFFIELAYHGKNYAGFQKQSNANTVQAEVEKALATYFKSPFHLTGSSRTDAGVHALQNFFHFDAHLRKEISYLEKSVYHLNAILPPDIVIRKLINMPPGYHCRFDAHSRAYEYTLYQVKNPFLNDRAYYYPYYVNFDLLYEAAQIVQNHNNFQSFSKARAQVKNYQCKIFKSHWVRQQHTITYQVTANRFLRGMVKGLVGTMLLVGREKISLAEFENIIISLDPRYANFAVPAHALTLKTVHFNTDLLRT